MQRADERRFNASAKTSAGCTRAVEELAEVAAYGKAVWSCRPVNFSDSERRKRPQQIKDLSDLC